MFNIPPETWLSWSNSARIWGIAITVFAGVITLVATIVQIKMQAIVSAKKRIKLPHISKRISRAYKAG